MFSCRRLAISGVLLVTTLGCRLLDRGPSDADVVAAVRKSPPAPPTLGPTFLAQVDSVEVQARGDYRRDGGYWPVRVRVKGAARIKVTNAFQLGVADHQAREKTESVDFNEEGRFSKDDFGNWRVSYVYDGAGPQWRLGGR
jgi:hypothetical protein